MLKKIFLLTGSALLLVVVALFIHIWIVAGKPAKHLAVTQLARIDFEQPLDSSQALALRSEVQGLPGVTHCYINVPDGKLVYSYDLTEQTSQAVFSRVARISPVPCKAFHVDAQDLAAGCPAMAPSGFYYTLSAWVRDLRN